jgi:hypothetical protein
MGFARLSGAPSEVGRIASPPSRAALVVDALARYLSADASHIRPNP